MKVSRVVNGVSPTRKDGSRDAPPEAKVAIAGLTKLFCAGRHTILALDDVDLSIPDGQFVCLVGPSGCGKTTLLRILAGLESPTAGEAAILRKSASKPANSMIFQEHAVFPWMTVYDNVAYGLRMRGVAESGVKEKVEEYIAKVGLSGFARAYPYQLSGGMRQRVSIARAFANDPEVLLMDEPFASVDEQTKILLQEELLRMWEEDHKTVIYITHSIDESLIMGDRVVVFTASPGRIKADIAVTFDRPREVYKLKANPAFGELAYRIWGLLRAEVIKTGEQEGPGTPTPAPERKALDEP